MSEVGRVVELNRYPIKSMAAVSVSRTKVGFHGIIGDRRLAFRRAELANGFPWLSASRLPEMLAYRPSGEEDRQGEPFPTHVNGPDGTSFAIGDDALNAHMSAKFGASLKLTHLKHGIFDEAPVSLLCQQTVESIRDEVGIPLDRRRFRANIVLDGVESRVFQEDDWVGARLRIGHESAGAMLHVTQRDYRCAMINLDPDTGARNADVMKTVLQMNDGNAGVYAMVIQQGDIEVGDRVWLDT